MINVIAGIINTSHLAIEYKLSTWNKKYLRYNKHLEIDTTEYHLLFNNPLDLCRAFKERLIYKTPILFDTYNSIQSLSIGTNIKYLDANIAENGLIYFNKIKTNELRECLDVEWDNDKQNSLLFISKKVKQFGRNASIGNCIGNILLSLPKFCYLPFMISFSHGIADKFANFELFIKDNRLVNKVNRSFFKELDESLFKLGVIVKFVYNNLLDMDLTDIKKHDKRNIVWLRKIIDFYKDYDLDNYMDDENNINLKYEGELECQTE